MGNPGECFTPLPFLEDTVGCRWWTSTESYIPSIPKLWIPEVDQTYVPPLSYREPFYLDASPNGVFAARLKNNGNFAQVSAAYGGHISILGWAETFYDIMPPDTYFGPHPEWYSLINGTRTSTNAQLCLTNAAMVQQAITNVLAWIAANPGTTIVSVSQNDNTNYCQCSVCQAAATAEGSQSGPIIRFVDSVAAAVKAQYPNVTVETLAYSYSAAPPHVTKPASNVLIRLCSMAANSIQPLNSSTNATFQTDLTGWEAIAPNLWIWDYVTDFANYIIPFPTQNTFGPNMSYFAASNVTGVFEEGDSASPTGDFCRLKCWVLAHLLWNPSLSETTLVNEFINGYYGAAAPYISSYLTAVYNAALAAGYPMLENNTNYSFLTLSVMNQAQQFLNSAAAAVAGNPTLSARVQRDSLPLDQAWVLCYPILKQQMAVDCLPFYGPTDQLTGCNSFILTALEYNAGSICEGESFANYEPQITWESRPAATVPTECAGLSGMQLGRCPG